MPLTPEEYLAKAKTELTPIAKGTSRGFTTKVLRLLGPVYGYSNSDVYRAQDACSGKDPLTALREYPAVGSKIPQGLIIGGHSGLKYGQLLHEDFRTLSWWKKFRGHMDTFGEAIWVLPIVGAGYWVIHNIAVNRIKQQPAIIIPARKEGLNHVRVMRLEAFVEEHRDE